MKTEKLIYFVMACIAGYFGVHAALIDTPVIRYGVAPVMGMNVVYCIIQLDITRYVQQFCTYMRLITIVSAYSVTGRYTAHQNFTHIESHIYFFWIPRLSVLSARTKLALDYMAKDQDVKVLEERWVGQYEK